MCKTKTLNTCIYKNTHYISVEVYFKSEKVSAPLRPRLHYFSGMDKYADFLLYFLTNRQHDLITGKRMFAFLSFIFFFFFWPTFESIWARSCENVSYGIRAV